jgi:lysophospholipase L1-like esterase
LTLGSALRGVAAAETPTFVRPDGAHVQTIGRFARNLSSGELMFDQPDTQIRLRVQNTKSVAILLRQRVPETHAEPSDFAVFVDGKLAKCTSHLAPNEFSSFTTLGAGNNTVVRYVIALEDSKQHQVNLFKLTEAAFNERNISQNYLTFSGFELMGNAASALPGPPLPSRKLEFIGDSITAGFCNLCHQTNATDGVTLESGALAWPAKICDALDAQCHKTAWSGFGVVRNCCGGDTLMPEIYQRTLATVEQSRWDFSSWIPDAVIVNLGTNDHLPNEPAPVDENFVAAYTDMIETAATRYGKNSTHFFLACGPMSEAYCNEVKNVLSNVASVGIHASFLDQRGLIQNACCGHPSVADDERIARKSAAFIKKTLQW